MAFILSSQSLAYHSYDHNNKGGGGGGAVMYWHPNYPGGSGYNPMPFNCLYANQETLAIWGACDKWLSFPTKL